MSTMGKESRIQTILRYLNDNEVAFPPKTLYDNLDLSKEIDFSYRTLKRDITDLIDRGLVEYVDVGNGYYRISEQGRQFLNTDKEVEEESVETKHRDELKNMREEIESEFEDVSPRVALIDPDKLGLWIDASRSGTHKLFKRRIRNLSEYLWERGYNVRSVWEAKRTPDDGDRYYNGHLYALPAEVGMPDFPRAELGIQIHEVETDESIADRTRSDI